MEAISKKSPRERVRASFATGILGGTVSLTVSTVIVKLLGVFYKIPLAHILGDEGMGYFNSAYTVYALFYLLCTAGVPKAVMILVSESKARGGINERSILRFAERVFVLLGLVTTFAFVFLSKPLAIAIGNESSALTMVAIAPSIVFISLAGVVRGFLSANLKLSAIAVSQILEGVGKLAFGLVFARIAIKNSLPMSSVSAFTILGVTIGAIFGLLYLKASARELGSSRSDGQRLSLRDKKSLIKRIFSISLPITLSAAVMSITNVIDLALIMRRLIENGYTELEATSLYGNYTTLAVSMFNLVVSLITPISIAFLPILTQAAARGDEKSFSLAYESTVNFTAILAAPLMVGLVVYSKEILTLLFGDMGVETGAPLLCLLTPALFFATSLLAVNSALEAKGGVKVPVISMAIGSAVKITVSYFLLGNPSFGISGAPIGTAASYAVALLVSLIIAYKKYNLKAPIFFGFLPPLASSLISIITSRFVFNGISAYLNPTVALLTAIFASAILYFLLTALTGGFAFINANNILTSHKK